MKAQGQGLYTAEVCCRQAGLVSMLGKLNGRVIDRPKTLQIKASTACKLQVTEKDPICCTAGLTPCCLCMSAAYCNFPVHLVMLVSQDAVHEHQKRHVLTPEQVYIMVDASNPVVSFSQHVLFEQ